MPIWSDAAARERLRDALLEAWPAPEPPALTWLAEGFGSAAFETPDGVLVLAAKNQLGTQARRNTIALGPALAPVLPVAVPLAVWSIESAAGLPFGAYAYRRLPGRPWTFEEAKAGNERMAEQIAAFLHALHTFPVPIAVDLGIPSFDDFWRDLISLRADTDAALKHHLTPAEYATVQIWWEAFLVDESIQAGPRCFVHGDLWWDNLLVDENGDNLTGILDLGDAAIVDPAYDFVPLAQAGPRFSDACVEAYRRLGGTLDASFEHRRDRWRELRSGSLFSIRTALREDDADELSDCLAKLRSSRMLRPLGLGKW